MRITIKDIAEHCGVGKATVSRAVNNSGSVKKEVRQRILNYIESIGWQASSTASALTTGKTYTVGIMVNSISYYFNHMMLEQLNQKLIKGGYQTVLSICHTVEELEKYRSKRVDGMIIFSPTVEMKEEISRLQREGIRVVIIGHIDEPPAPVIFSDKFAAGQTAMQKCLESACRKVMFLGALTNFSTIKNVAQIEYPSDRILLEGITTYATQQNFDFKVSDCLGHPDEKMISAILRSKKYDGCICFTVLDLIKLYSCCRELKLRIPEDISVIAIEADDFFHALNPEPTYFIHDYKCFAETAIKLLFSTEPIPEKTIVPYIFVNGQSLR